MARTSTNPPYWWLAQYYDEFFAAVRSPMDVARQHVLGRILPHTKSACDLACGTGTTALALAREGIRMFAVDLSPIICRLSVRRLVATAWPYAYCVPTCVSSGYPSRWTLSPANSMP